MSPSLHYRPMLQYQDFVPWKRKLSVHMNQMAMMFISNYFCLDVKIKFSVGLMTCQVRYNAHSPMVLLGVSCKIRSGERVGIVGRTGSGKSTFIQALFRMVEPVYGSIIIDDVDISTIGIPAKHILTHNLKPALCTTFVHLKPPNV